MFTPKQCQTQWKQGERTEDQLEGVGDGEREEIAVSGRVHVRVTNDNNTRDDVPKHASQ